MILRESITHIEDLDLQNFLRVVSSIAQMRASEKLDGANLWFGLDAKGNLYTSRIGKRKSAESFYQESDYPYFSANNGFRSALAALKSKEEKIKGVLRPGDTVEIEILYGRQPNSVTYGANGRNFIAFLRGVEGTQDILVDQLVQTLAGETATVKVKIVDTTDGERLDLKDVDITYEFVGAQKLDSSKIADQDVEKIVGKLNSFLDAKVTIGKTEISNFDLVTSSLIHFDKTEREEAKRTKELVLSKIMTDFKLPIKKLLLSKTVSGAKSKLAASDMTSDEDVGIEGIVLQNPENGEQVKIVDKDTFLTINRFNYAARNEISGVVRTTDGTASLEARGGLVGELKIIIADLLGNKNLARGAEAKKFFSTFKGATVEETVRNGAAQLNGGDDYLGTRRKVLALIENTQQKLSAALKDFKDNKDQFKLKLKNGKTIGLSAEIIRRTLLQFAETKRNVAELHTKIKKTKTLAQLVAILYARHAKAVHNVEEKDPLSEETLMEKRATTDKALYQGKDGWTLFNTYFATYAMAAVIYHENDKQGIRFLRDKSHMHLTAWSKDMSAFNFWGYPIWRCGTPAVKKLIGKKTAAEMFKYTRKVPPGRWKLLHIDMSFGREVPIEWEEHRKTLGILQQYAGLNIDRINTILDGALKYPSMTFDEKVKYHTRLYYYVQQFIPSSPLATRLRVLYNNMLLNATGNNTLMTENMKLIRSVASLVEDENGGTATATTASSIASFAYPLTNKIIVRRKRNAALQLKKFPKPKEEK